MQAKPSRHLWVGGIGRTVSGEVIEGEFKRFGIMEDFKFLRDRNCAFVDYEKIEDAISAVDSLNRKRLGDEELRVDFGRSQPHKRVLHLASASPAKKEFVQMYKVVVVLVVICMTY